MVEIFPTRIIIIVVITNLIHFIIILLLHLSCSLNVTLSCSRAYIDTVYAGTSLKAAMPIVAN